LEGKYLAGSTSKKIVAVRFEREPVQGFIDPHSFLRDAGVELLTTTGALVTLPHEEVKAVCFVKDFEPNPSWRQNRAFSNRPKTEGLWLRLHFRDADTLEGVMANDLLLVESLGFAVAPPEAGFQNQKIFVLRAALTHVQVLGVVGSPLHRRSKPRPGDREQLKMFE
jgi:hypothetical protein